MIILASNSPRRKDLMKEHITPSFIVEPSRIDESIYRSSDPIKMSQLTARAKGEFIFAKHPDDTIISADTIVVNDNMIYGKPKNMEDAFQMIKSMLGKTHEVITSYYIVDKTHSINRSVISKVTFKKVSDDIIKQYIEKFPPLDKAGSYGIQDDYFASHILDHYEGSLTNIIGLPIEKISEDLKGFSLNY